MSKTKCFTCRKTINREHTQKFDYAPDGKLRAYHLKCRQPHKVCVHGVVLDMVGQTSCGICKTPVQYNRVTRKHETASKPRFFGGLRETLARVLTGL